MFVVLFLLAQTVLAGDGGWGLAYDCLPEVTSEYGEGYMPVEGPLIVRYVEPERAGFCTVPASAATTALFLRKAHSEKLLPLRVEIDDDHYTARLYPEEALRPGSYTLIRLPYEIRHIEVEKYSAAVDLPKTPESASLTLRYPKKGLPEEHLRKGEVVLSITPREWPKPVTLYSRVTCESPNVNNWGSARHGTSTYTQPLNGPGCKDTPTVVYVQYLYKETEDGYPEQFDTWSAPTKFWLGSFKDSRSDRGHYWEHHPLPFSLVNPSLLPSMVGLFVSLFAAMLVALTTRAPPKRQRISKPMTSPWTRP